MSTDRPRAYKIDALLIEHSWQRNRVWSHWQDFINETRAAREYALLRMIGYDATLRNRDATVVEMWEPLAEHVAERHRWVGPSGRKVLVVRNATGAPVRISIDSGFGNRALSVEDIRSSVEGHSPQGSARRAQLALQHEQRKIEVNETRERHQRLLGDARDLAGEIGIDPELIQMSHNGRLSIEAETLLTILRRAAS